MLCFKCLKSIALVTVLSVSSIWGFAVQADLDKGMDAIEKQDYMTAYQEFKKAAEVGNIDAQHNLAILFKQGKGVMKDSEAAAKWFRKAADQGLSESQYYLGYMYDMGEGVQHSFEYAALWYKKAAEKGHARAQTNLGVLYANGDGIKQDIVQAYVWLNLAASQGSSEALKNRELIAEQMTPKMLENVRKVSREFYQRYMSPFASKEMSRSFKPPSEKDHK